MQLVRPIAYALFALAPLAAAAAQDDIASKIVNDPGAPQVNGAKAKLVDDAAVQGGKALRVTVARKGKNVWDSAVESALAKPVKAGDTLIIAFQARLVKGEGGATTGPIPYTAIQLKSEPYTGVVSGNLTVGPDWEFHKIEGKADKDYAADALKATIHVGNAPQTIDFGPIVVLNMGQ